MMGIWVRSQDKQILMYCTNFIINFQNKKQIISDAGYYEPDAESYRMLGEYPTEERAFRVLDEMQEHLKNIEKNKLYIAFYNADSCLDTDPFFAVFQMPKE